jgi:diacylglycerol kinase family enzyme/acid phosphatase family membrane protein YuiD
MARRRDAMVQLSAAADHGRLWIGAAALLAAIGGRHGRRAALRGMLSLGLAAGGAQILKPLVQRRRPRNHPIRQLRLRRRSQTGAFPSGHASSAFAFATGAAMEAPGPGAVALGLATAVATSRVLVGEHRTSDVVAGAALGVGTAALTRHWWPVASREPARVRTITSGVAEPSPTGAGLTVVVNASAGPSIGRDPVDEIRAGLPDAEIIEIEDGSELDAALQKAAEGVAIGMAGGDGSVNAAAAVADEAGKPLLVVPAGTLNHLARDLGLASVADAVEAVRRGETAAVDLATIDGRPFLNTASFGSYVELVDMRERLEGVIGKWPAVAVALVRVLRRAEPCQVEIDGDERRVWMIFIGNCRYHPSGFAPSWRERLDDGHLDVRLVDGDAPFSRARLVLAVLTGRLGRCRVYSQRLASEVHVRSLGGPLRLARDGETFQGSAEFTIAKAQRPLPVFVPKA